MKEERESVVLNENDEFSFACHGDLPCYTQCCRDVNIYLTPYDVLRMRKSLNMGSSEFLSKYTRSFLAKVTHIPVVQLLMNPDNLYCLFVTPDGCKIYDDRPWACRMYPLDINVKKTGSYKLITSSDRCFGLKEPQKWKVKTWLSSQGIEPYEKMDNLFQSVMPPEFRPGEKMDAGLGKLLFLAYDTDIFLEMLKDPKFRKLHDIDDQLYKTVLEDDEELLKLAFSYIKAQMEELYPLT